MVQPTVAPDELPPESEPTDLALGLDGSGQEGGREERPIARKVIQPGSTPKPVGLRRSPAGFSEDTGQFCTTHRTSAGAQRARTLTVREVQPDLTALVFDLVPEASVPRRTQRRPERKPRSIRRFGRITATHRLIDRLPPVGIHQRRHAGPVAPRGAPIDSGKLDDMLDPEGLQLEERSLEEKSLCGHADSACGVPADRTSSFDIRPRRRSPATPHQS